MRIAAESSHYFPNFALHNEVAQPVPFSPTFLGHRVSSTRPDIALRLPRVDLRFRVYLDRRGVAGFAHIDPDLAEVAGFAYIHPDLAEVTIGVRGKDSA